MAKTSEPKLGLAVLQVLASQPSREAHMRTIIKKIPKYINLTEDDYLPSGTRPNETMWEQRVRNIKSHDTAEGNIIGEGYMTRVGRGRYALTDAGHAHLEHNKLI